MKFFDDWLDEFPGDTSARLLLGEMLHERADPACLAPLTCGRMGWFLHWRIVHQGFMWQLRHYPSVEHRWAAAVWFSVYTTRQTAEGALAELAARHSKLLRKASILRVQTWTR